MNCRIRYLRPSARVLYEAEGGLAYATPLSAGLDLRACLEDEELVIPAGGRAKVPAGIAVEPLAPDVAGFVYSRSGLGAVHGLTVAQGVGVIDPDYRGEILVFLLNTSGEERRLRRGERMAQLIFQPIVRMTPEAAETLGETQRGAGGFGHTGKN
ncbi:MAG: dUTP diphosphatase [Deltaproteobacteria bacterium]|nr:dUTP diphosphatase [Deltaproteobacteria bacterium]